MTDEMMVYFFGAGHADGNGQDKELLGGKGANLAEMTRIGVPVPPGFTITTQVCLDFRDTRALPDLLAPEVSQALEKIEDVMGANFGDPQNPLLVSVRSGAPASMPGMMDTVLNVGLNDTTVKGLAAISEDERFAYDSYRRFIQMFGDVVLGVSHSKFEKALTEAKESAQVSFDNELTAAQLRGLVATYKGLIAAEGLTFPEDPREQLNTAITAVFSSWDNNRAVAYREMNDIPNHWGTAVNVQAMVFGNLGDGCATGVAFTRNPATGDNIFYGEFLLNAQGEDVVAGIRTPHPLSGVGGKLQSLEEAMPKAYAELAEIRSVLELHYREMQDVEFTIQKGKVWMLQTRNGKRTAAAAVKIAVEMANEELITRDEALLRVTPEQVDRLLHPALDPDAERDVVATGLPASPGAATGRVVFDAETAEAWAATGKSVILVRSETSPEDIKGMAAAEGILTAHGGMTSHAAVVARQMGTCCVAGCSTLRISGKTATMGTRTFEEGDVMTLDGSSGEVISGEVPRIPPHLDEFFETLMTWADGRRRIDIRTNADRGVDATLARNFGAGGIGLVRTEHMFFQDGRINSMREMILAETLEARLVALEKLRPLQQADFEDILRSMDGLSCTVRLLDPPLHEFLPERKIDIRDLAKRMHISTDDVVAMSEHLHEANPMLGHRGCRLAITYPEIYEMQVRALFDATATLIDEGLDPHPEVMIPLVSMASELEFLRPIVEKIRSQYVEKYPHIGKTPIGTMIELPRACATSDKIAEYADFLSFGTNDLTQTVFGFSRDDAGSFIPAYVEQGIFKNDPFAVLDIDGVGEMIKMACWRARNVKPKIKIGICGEHGGEPHSVRWLQRGFVEYVSCSPYRVPIARLAAAQAAILDDAEGITNDTDFECCDE